MKKEILHEIIALLNTADFESITVQEKRDQVIEAIKKELNSPELICESLEDFEELIAWNLSQNHTKRYGVIKGRFSRTYSFMHKDKNEVLRWLVKNFKITNPRLR